MKQQEGWSNHNGGSNGRAHKLHYFKNGKSICGMQTLSDWNFKHKFVDVTTWKGEKKICIRCRERHPI